MHLISLPSRSSHSALNCYCLEQLLNGHNVCKIMEDLIMDLQFHLSLEKAQPNLIDNVLQRE